MSPEKPGDGTLLVVDQVSYCAGRRAFGPISLHVGRKEIVGLLGPRGAGKASLLRAIAGETRITGGEILIERVSIARYSKSQRQEAGMRACMRDRRRWRANRSLLETVGAAIASGAQLLLVEEALASLPTMAPRLAMIVMLKACRDAGLGVLITDSGVRDALDLVDRAYIVSEGRVLAEGTSEYLRSDPRDMEPPPRDAA
jgi:lipopolysaccharide export system ATP-binding protein